MNPDINNGNGINNKEKKMSLSFALAEVLKNLWLKFDDKKSYPPENFKKLISEMNPLFRGIQANDPKDLILFMLETMHSELNNPTNQYNFGQNIINNQLIYSFCSSISFSPNKASKLLCGLKLTLTLFESRL